MIILKECSNLKAFHVSKDLVPASAASKSAQRDVDPATMNTSNVDNTQLEENLIRSFRYRWKAFLTHALALIRMGYRTQGEQLATIHLGGCSASMSSIKKR
ncbi:hypothetical protein N7G274_002744 [Stereocaulon virgatum]|uniref:Uncharacterized protein n=1 Tax=Stereocaulon virgatum TaxID=373712 RepID=A0ABR4AGR2_9LECA